MGIQVLFSLFNGDIVLFGIINLFIPAHTPFTYGRDHFHRGIQCRDVIFKANLIISFSRRAVSYDLDSPFLCHTHGNFRECHSGKGSRQRIPSLVIRIGFNGARQQFFSKFLPGVNDHRLFRTEPDRLGFYRLKILM